MIDSIISLFTKLKLPEKITKRHIGIVLLIFLCVVIGMFVVEYYTSYFRFSRLVKATQLLKDLSDIKDKIQDDEKLRNVHEAILANLEDILGIEAAQLKEHSRFWKFVLGFIPWFLLSTLFIPSIKKGRRDLNVLYGVWIIGCFFAFISMFLPELFWPWLHLIVYPILLIVLFAILSIVFTMRASSEEKKLEALRNSEDQEVAQSS